MATGKRTKCQCKCKNLRKYFSEYCENTSIHGLHYFAQNRTKLEILFWIVAEVTALMFVCYMIYVLGNKFISVPVIVSFSTKETPIFKIPFPTVTICSNARFTSTTVNYAELMRKVRTKQNLTEEELSNLNYAAPTCYEQFQRTHLREKFYQKTLSNDVIDFFNKTKRHFLHNCFWMGMEMECDDFTPVLTEDGVCWSFNNLDKSELFRDDVYNHPDFFNSRKSDWDIEEGYKSKSVFGYPGRSLMSGHSKALVIILYSKRRTVDPLCVFDDGGGYEVSVHIPGKQSRLSQDFITVGSNMNVMAAIQPSIISTSSAVKDYPSSRRDCFFQSEKRLRFYKIYTQSNCFLECYANATLQTCDCVPFYMPRTNDTRICGVGSAGCIKVAEEVVLLKTLSSKVGLKDEIFEMFENYSTTFSCNCLPMCSDINYNMEISQSPFKNQRWIKRMSEKKKYNDSDVEYDESQIKDLYVEDDEVVDVASLTLFMKKNHVETKERNEVYGFIDFLSGFGGLLGLFTGFSLLSFTEIIYFLTVRIFGNFKLFGNWHGEKHD